MIRMSHSLYKPSGLYTLRYLDDSTQMSIGGNALPNSRTYIVFSKVLPIRYRQQLLDTTIPVLRGCTTLRSKYIR